MILPFKIKLTARAKKLENELPQKTNVAEMYKYFQQHTDGFSAIFKNEPDGSVSIYVDYCN